MTVYTQLYISHVHKTTHLYQNFNIIACDKGMLILLLMKLLEVKLGNFKTTEKVNTTPVITTTTTTTTIIIKQVTAFYFFSGVAGVVAAYFFFVPCASSKNVFSFKNQFFNQIRQLIFIFELKSIVLFIYKIGYTNMICIYKRDSK